MVDGFMSKTVIRTMILIFLFLVTALTYYMKIFIISHLAIFWLGMTIMAIVAKEHEKMEVWAASKGVCYGNKIETERKGIEEGKRKVIGRDSKAKTDGNK